jgi:hypothetical protein
VKRLTWKEPNSWGLRKFFGEKCRWNVSGVQNRRSMSTWWDDVWNLTTMVRCFICKLITWPSKCIQTRLGSLRCGRRRVSGRGLASADSGRNLKGKSVPKNPTVKETAKASAFETLSKAFHPSKGGRIHRR